MPPPSFFLISPKKLSHYKFLQVNYDLVEERNESVGGIYAPHAPSSRLSTKS